MAVALAGRRAGAWHEAAGAKKTTPALTARGRPCGGGGWFDEFKNQFSRAVSDETGRKRNNLGRESCFCVPRAPEK